MGDWFDDSATGAAADVLLLLDSNAAKYLDACIAAGALVSFGLTSDGGALGVTVTVDGRWRREYFRDVDTLEVWCQAALEATEIAVAARAASPGARQRSRSPRGR